MSVLCREQRDYIKFLKRGYSRVSQINALNVRHKRMTPAEAKEINEKFDGRKPPSLDIFLEYVGLTENEFNEIVDRTSFLHINQIIIPMKLHQKLGILINGIEKITKKNDRDS